MACAPSRSTAVALAQCWPGATTKTDSAHPQTVRKLLGLLGCGLCLRRVTTERRLARHICACPRGRASLRGEPPNPRVSRTSASEMPPSQEAQDNLGHEQLEYKLGKHETSPSRINPPITQLSNLRAVPDLLCCLKARRVEAEAERNQGHLRNPRGRKRKKQGGRKDEKHVSRANKAPGRAETYCTKTRTIHFLHSSQEFVVTKEYRRKVKRMGIKEDTSVDDSGLT